MLIPIQLKANYLSFFGMGVQCMMHGSAVPPIRFLFDYIISNITFFYSYSLKKIKIIILFGLMISS